MGMHIPSSLTSQKEQQTSKSLDLASLSTSQWPRTLNSVLFLFHAPFLCNYI